jgi:uncharacterized protein with HEPN domain
MLDAIAWIERLASGRTRDDYLADRPLRDAVERNLERVSEASRHLPDEILAKHGKVPWRQVRDLGNVLRHGYDALDDEQVWEIVVRDLPSLRAAVEAMLAELDASERESPF